MARIVLLLLIVTLMGGCVYLPNTTDIYDKQCGTYHRHMSLELHQVGVLAGCGNEACVAALVFFGVVTAASAVVSGSVVLVGNVVHWLEWHGRCPEAGQKSE
jgi:ABC-type multidrug transport system permease subunit